MEKRNMLFLLFLGLFVGMSIGATYIVVRTIDIDTSAEIKTLVTDETGSATGTPLLVFNQNPTLAGVTLSGTLTANSVVELGDGGDTFALSSTGIDIDTSGNIANCGTVGCGAITSTGAFASLDIPAIGNDPDVATAGYIGRDNDDHWLRGYDGTIQFVYSGKGKVICGTATNPDLLTEAAFLPIWTNQLGASFVIDNIYAVSDVDDAVFTLKFTTNDYTDHTNLTTIEAVTISTNGTGIYYYSIAFADIDSATIANNKTIGYDAGATDCDFIHFAIVGHLLGDVN